jgi:hypothetical protein
LPDLDKKEDLMLEQLQQTLAAEDEIACTNTSRVFSRRKVAAKKDMKSALAL